MGAGWFLAAFLALHLYDGVAAIDNRTETYILNWTSPIARIESPGFPYRPYPPLTMIHYDVKIQPRNILEKYGARIVMHFEMFALEDSEFCTKDSLEIADKGESRIKVFCGGAHTGLAVLSESNHVRMRFYSDDEDQERGFRLRLTMLPTDCSGEFIDQDVVEITSPNYPNNYRRDDICIWRMKVPEGYVIKGEFLDVFDIRSPHPNCVQDYVTISLKGENNLNILRFCKNKPPDPVISHTNEMFVLFRSDCCFEGSGFKLRMTKIKKPVEAPPPTSLDKCDCGFENKHEKRIIGGEEVSPKHRYPWMVALNVTNSQTSDCGGVLVNHQFVLTAAHCLYDQDNQGITVALGVHNLVDGEGNRLGVAWTEAHQNYDPVTYSNDIGLIKLSRPVQFSKNIAPICLPPAGLETDETTGRVAGWGWLNPVRASTTILQEAEIPILPNSECFLKYQTAMRDTNLCAGAERRDACPGDSGGPLMQKIDGRWVAAGLVSFGIGCGRKGYPGIYTRVTSYLDWIRDRIGGCDSELPPPSGDNPEDCGISKGSKIEKRVVGGNETRPLEYPWLAIVTLDRKIRGHGALVNDRYVMTAANNLIKWWPKDTGTVKVAVGLYDLTKKSPSHKTFGVERVLVHPQLNKPQQYDNDLALIRLDGKVDRGQLPPICLPPQDAAYDHGTKTMVVGWGRMGNGQPGSEKPREVNLPIVSHKLCSLIYPGMLSSTMICAGGMGRADACEFDWGTPLQYEYMGRWYAAGLFIANANEGCGKEGKPSIFTALHFHSRWIRYVTK